MMAPTPLLLSPALPSELIAYIIQHTSHPTTLLICSPRADFLASLLTDVQTSLDPKHQSNPDAQHEQHQRQHQLQLPASSLLAAPLYQVAIARHIRILFIPTVSHLRAYLAVFNPADSKIPPPPLSSNAGATIAGDGTQQKQPPLLLVYGFLGLHRDTSEWSAQGIGASAAGVVDAARKCGFRAVVVDAPTAGGVRAGSEGGLAEGDGRGEVVLGEEVPLLSASVLRAGGDALDDAVWTGRKVPLSRILGRWFRYREGEWAGNASEIAS